MIEKMVHEFMIIIRFFEAFIFGEPVNLLTITLRLLVITSILMLSVLAGDKLVAVIAVRIKLNSAMIRQIRSEKNMNVKSKKEYGFKLFRYIDRKLIKNGRPFGLTAFRYLATKTVLAVIVSIPPLLVNSTLLTTSFFAIPGFFILDIILIIDSIDNNHRMEKDMPNVINDLYMQLEANIPFKQCLESLHMSCIHSKLLKNALKELQVRFVMKDHDIVAVCDEIEENFSNIGLSVLLMAFRQYKDSGKMKDILKRQNEIHMKKEQDMIDRESRRVIQTAAVSTVLIAVNCMLMLVYPMYITMMEKMNEVLK